MGSCVWEVEGTDRVYGKLAAETPGLISSREFNLTCKCKQIRRPVTRCV